MITYNYIEFNKKREENLIDKLGLGWYNKLKSFLWSKEFQEIKNFLKTKAQQKKQILPHTDNLFNCFKLTPWEYLKIVIIGNTPYDIAYKGEIICDGLAYSYNSLNPTSMDIPIATSNIIKEIDLDLYGEDAFPGRDANLTDLALQGVLLLNSELTCELNFSAAHKNLWTDFIIETISVINNNNSGIIFMLWGSVGQKYKSLIDLNKHYILEAGDPFLGGNNWFGKSNFSKANKIIKENNGPEFQIVWTNQIF